jgi:predicted transcriptional regulator
MAYLNDIIIYLNNIEEYKEYIKWVLRKLYKKNILVTVKKNTSFILRRLIL